MLTLLLTFVSLIVLFITACLVLVGNTEETDDDILIQEFSGVIVFELAIKEIDGQDCSVLVNLTNTHDDTTQFVQLWSLGVTI